jgi:hypothetical protein
MIKKTTLFLCTLFALDTQAQQVINDADKAKPILETIIEKDTTYWTYGGVFNIGGNQGILHNWAAGGELASFTVNGIFNGFTTLVSGRNIWANNLDLNYGLNYTYSNKFIPRKTDDRIDFTSKYGRKLSKNSKCFLTGLFNFKSQFTKGYDYSILDWQNNPTSEFLSPAYFTLAPGFEYRKGNNLSVFFSPIAARLTLVDTKYTNLSPQGAFGVPFGKSSRFELGAYLSARYFTEISKTVSFRTRLDLYSNYLAKDVKDAAGVVVRKDNPGNITMLSDNLMTFKFNKHLSVSIGLVMIYDNAVPYSTTYVDKAGVTQTKDEPLKELGWMQVRQNVQFGLEYKLPLSKK